MCEQPYIIATFMSKDVKLSITLQVIGNIEVI